MPCNQYASQSTYPILVSGVSTISDPGRRAATLAIVIPFFDGPHLGCLAVRPGLSLKPICAIHLSANFLTSELYLPPAMVSASSIGITPSVPEIYLLLS
jgi:hypothetical protein